MLDMYRQQQLFKPTNLILDQKKKPNRLGAKDYQLDFITINASNEM